MAKFLNSFKSLHRYASTHSCLVSVLEINLGTEFVVSLLRHSLVLSFNLFCFEYSRSTYFNPSLSFLLIPRSIVTVSHTLSRVIIITINSWLLPEWNFSEVHKKWEGLHLPFFSSSQHSLKGDFLDLKVSGYYITICGSIWFFCQLSFAYPKKVLDLTD